MLTLDQDMLKQVMNPESCLLPSLHKDYPSHVRIDLMKRAQGPGVCTRMINTILSTLKARGEGAWSLYWGPDPVPYMCLVW